MQLIYIHGFLSGPESAKAQQVEAWISDHRPDIQFNCPSLSAYPGEAIDTLEHIITSNLEHIPMLMGSSLGGYWATWLVESCDLPAVIINPAVRPSILLPEYLGVELKNYYSDEAYTLSDTDIDILLSVEKNEISSYDNFWMMTQTGDETLDYQLAVKKYSSCHQLVEEGGNHSFVDFQRWIPSAIDFLTCRREQILDERPY